MELQAERLIPASVDRTWSALNDPQVLKDCIPGCESLQRNGDNAFDVVVAVRVGPVGARFNGKLVLSHVQPPKSYTIEFEGQGGAAGFGKGSAEVSLEPEVAGTRLRYSAKAQVGGKIAQIGSRLVDAAAGKITEDFFKAFEARLQAEATPQAAAAPAAQGAGMRALWWLIAALVAAAIAYFALR